MSREILRRRRRTPSDRSPKFSIAVMIAFIACLAFADILPLKDPTQIALADRLVPPLWADDGTATYLLGTDSLGRDVLSRLVYGARVSAIVGFATIAIAAIIGTFLGVLAGYFGGFIDLVLTRAIDATLTVPVILAALVFVVFLGPGYVALMVSLVLFLWGRFARVVRGETLRLKEEDFVKRAVVVGGVRRALVLHLSPNLLDTVLVLATLNLGLVIVAEPSLSFLGLGIPPPTPSWGNMVSEGRGFLREAWWLAVLPGLAIMAVVLAFSQIGDWLRDRASPFEDRVLEG